ncbi:MAG: Rid family hydrolase, partial [Gemmatimonadaceae bacterium]
MTPRWTPITPAGDAPPPAGAYSSAIRAGDFLFVSGQVPRDPQTGETIGSNV